MYQLAYGIEEKMASNETEISENKVNNEMIIESISNGVSTMAALAERQMSAAL